MDFRKSHATLRACYAAVQKTVGHTTFMTSISMRQTVCTFSSRASLLPCTMTCLCYTAAGTETAHTYRHAHYRLDLLFVRRPTSKHPMQTVQMKHLLVQARVMEQPAPEYACVGKKSEHTGRA